MSAHISRNAAALRRLAAGAAACAFLLSASAQAASPTRLEDRLAAAAGAAAARAADRAAQHAVLYGAVRYRRPACLAGAREFRLHGFRHLVFMRECMRVL